MSLPCRVLVTGGAGYIGSHTCKRLASEGLEPVVFDNLRQGRRHNVKWGPLAIGDLLDGERLAEVFNQYRPEAVIHFAALLAPSTIRCFLYHDPIWEWAKCT
jgi:UDP-arabinose 4-epimerase